MTKPAISISVEVSGIGIDGDPEEVGLVNQFEDNTPRNAEHLLEMIKAECDNDKHRFISDWDLIDDPRITIGVVVDGVHTYVDW